MPRDPFGVWEIRLPFSRLCLTLGYLCNHLLVRSVEFFNGYNFLRQASHHREARRVNKGDDHCIFYYDPYASIVRVKIEAVWIVDLIDISSKIMPHHSVAR